MGTQYLVSYPIHPHAWCRALDPWAPRTRRRAIEKPQELAGLRTNPLDRQLARGVVSGRNTMNHRRFRRANNEHGDGARRVQYLIGHRDSFGMTYPL